jgi:Zn-finger nucleic acid-binding protein
MRSPRQLLACNTPGCTRRFWRRRGHPFDKCPRCRAAVNDRLERERAQKQRERLVSLKQKAPLPDKPTIPEREALILHWMRAG